MIIHEIQQGTQAWLSLRASHFTASEAPAMLGLSRYKTRAELLREKATCLVAEVDAATQRRFDAGHAAEASARPIAEEEIGSELYPATCTAEIDGLPLLASLDGITMMGDVVWEQKLFNAEFAAMVDAGIVPDTHWPQIEQQLLVTGATKALFSVSDGTPEHFHCLWYTSQPARRAQLLSGWKQFAADLAAYQHTEAKPEAIGHAPEQLPALHIEVTGMVTASNLVEFKATALAVFQGINTNLQSDQDFADAEKAVKFCKDAEDRLEAAKSHALSQTASIDDLFRTIDAIKEEARTVRLRLDKLVKAEKENRKAEIITQARKAIEDHVAALNKRIGGNWMPQTSAAPFAEAIKGLKSLDSMRDKVSTALANAKVDANEIADRIAANRRQLVETDSMALFPDFAVVCTKAADEFDALLSLRVTQRKAADERRLEDERARIRAEESAKMVAEKQQAREQKNAEWREAAPVSEPVKIDARAAVVEHQDVIAAFMATRDWKDANHTRAVLVEFVKFQASNMMRRAA